MLRLNTQQHRSPIGGHHFKTHGVMFKADTFKELEQKIRDFRIANGIPLGNPDQDILIHYAKHFPWMVRSDSEPVTNAPTNYTEWRGWVSTVWSDPPINLITRKEADLRWDICLKCPMNKAKDWKETNEAAEYSRRAYQLRRGIPVPEKLGYCACHRADLSVLSLIKEAVKFSGKKDLEEPKDCWVSSLAG